MISGGFTSRPVVASRHSTAGNVVPRKLVSSWTQTRRRAAPVHGSEQCTDVIQLIAQPLTAEAFAPFGQVLGVMLDSAAADTRAESPPTQPLSAKRTMPRRLWAQVKIRVSMGQMTRSWRCLLARRAYTSCACLVGACPLIASPITHVSPSALAASHQRPGTWSYPRLRPVAFLTHPPASGWQHSWFPTASL